MVPGIITSRLLLGSVLRLLVHVSVSRAYTVLFAEVSSSTYSTDQVCSEGRRLSERDMPRLPRAGNRLHVESGAIALSQAHGARVDLACYHRCKLNPTVPGRKPTRKRSRQRRRDLFLRPDPQMAAPQPLPSYRRPFVRLTSPLIVQQSAMTVEWV